MTWLTLRALLAKVPALAWGIAVVLALLTAGGYAMFVHGKDAGVRETKRAALVVETRASVARVDTAHAHSQTVIAVAKRSRASTDSLLARRVTLREAAKAELMDAGLPKIHALIAHDDSIAASVPVTIALQAAATDTVQAEVGARSHLDSVRVETIAVGQPEPDHHTVLKIAGGVLVGVVGVLTLIHFAR